MTGRYFFSRQPASREGVAKDKGAVRTTSDLSEISRDIYFHLQPARQYTDLKLQSCHMDQVRSSQYHGLARLCLRWKHTQHTPLSIYPLFLHPLKLDGPLSSAKVGKALGSAISGQLLAPHHTHKRPESCTCMPQET